MKTLARVGQWEAFGGTAADGRAECGIATGGLEGRRFAIVEYAGERDLTVQLDKDTWAIPEGTPIDVTVQIDGGASWGARGVGAGRHVELPLPSDQAVGVMHALRVGRQLRVQFPSGDEPVWTGGLGGSGAAMNAFNACRANWPPPGGGAATQPYRAPHS